MSYVRTYLRTCVNVYIECTVLLLVIPLPAQRVCRVYACTPRTCVNTYIRIIHIYIYILYGTTASQSASHAKGVSWVYIHMSYVHTNVRTCLRIHVSYSTTTSQSASRIKGVSCVCVHISYRDITVTYINTYVPIVYIFMLYGTTTDQSASYRKGVSCVHIHMSYVHMYVCMQKRSYGTNTSHSTSRT